MHYRNGKIGYDVLEDIQDCIAHTFPQCVQLQTSSYVYTNTPKIITLMPKGVEDDEY